MIILEFFDRLLSLFAYPGDPDRQRKHALRALLREIDRKGPEWYKPWTNRVSAQFAADADKLRRACVRMGEVYRATIDSAPEDALSALASISDRILKGLGISMEALSFDSIRSEVEKGGNVDDVEAMDALFKKRTDVFNSKAFKRAAAGYRTNLRIAALCAYKWDPLLRPLAGKAGSFSAKPIARDLADLHYLISDIEADENARNFFRLLYDSCVPSSYSSEEANSDFSYLESVLSKDFEEAGFGRAVRAANGDADFELREFEINDDFRNALTEKLIADFTGKRNALAERVAEERLENTRKKLFGEAPLLPTMGYSAEFSESLIRAGFPPLDYLRPLSVIKSYLAALYVPRIHPAITKALVDLDFRDVGFRTFLSDEADKTAAIADSLLQFEGHTENLQLSDIFSDLENVAAEGLKSAKIKRAVQEINAKAHGIIQDTFKHAYEVEKSMRSLRDDIRSRTPELVANAGLVNIHHPKTAKGIDESVALLGLFYTLLQDTAVDESAAKRAVAENEARNLSD